MPVHVSRCRNLDLILRVKAVKKSHSPFVYSHELGYKGFEMEDDFLHVCQLLLSQKGHHMTRSTYAAHPYPVLVESAPLHHVCFQSIVDLGHELEGERLCPALAPNTVLISMLCLRRTLRMVVAGIQCVSRSYNFARTCRILAGERSSMISFAMTSIRASQSGGGMGVFSVTCSLPAR